MNNSIIDAKERLQAINPGESFIVQAPAGSGKTELLIQRLLSLLAEVKSPQEILAITFTKKAANEMRERIIYALELAEHPEPLEPHKQLTWQLAKKVLENDKKYQWQLMLNPNQLKLQTIDSFCSFLTKQLPVLSYFGSSPEITSRPEALYTDAVQELLSHVNEELDWSESIARVLLYMDNDLSKLERLLIDLIQRRDQWQGYLKHGSDSHEIKALLEASLREIIHSYIADLQRHLPQPHTNVLHELYTFCANMLEEKELVNCEELLSPTHQHLAQWKLIANILLTSSGEWRKRVDKNIGFLALTEFKNKEEKNTQKHYRELHKQLLKDLAENDIFRKSLNNIRTLPSYLLHDNHAEILIDLILILKVLSAQLQLEFKKHGCIDFCENNLAALKALGEEESPTDLALSLDYQFNHILIDEFQDTSATQYNLLYKLTAGWMPEDGRTLFIVGDPMQSIYRFREAEVGLFLRMQQKGIHNLKLTPLTLKVNFRSKNEIIEKNNLFYKAIFPKETHIPLGAVCFNPSHTIHTDPDQEAKVVIQGFSVDSPEQANYICDRITSIQQQSPSHTIAILVRSRTHLANIIPALKEHEIAYQALDIDPLEKQQHIQDIVSLCRALFNYEDRIAWLAVLRAPWCGLSLDDLFAIGNNKALTIWQSLIDQVTQRKLSTQGQAQVARILPPIKQALENRNRDSLRFWIEKCWLLLGGPATLQNKNDFNDISVFLKLLEDHEQSTQALLIDSLEDCLKKLYAEPSNQSKVQLMTIHSSKGLEFDAVFIPHLEKKPRSDDRNLLAWMDFPLDDNHSASLLAPISSYDSNNAIYDFIYLQNKAKAQNESDRLLYVATTRAKSRLYLTFETKPEDRSFSSGSFLHKLSPFIKEDMLRFEGVNQSILNKTLKQENLYRLQTDWLNPYTVINETGVKKHQKYEGFYTLSQHEHIAGTAIHLILQKLSSNAASWWNNMQDTQKIKYAQYVLKTLNLPFSQLLFFAKFVVACINNCLNDQRGQWILNQNIQAYSEYAISTRNGDEVENIILDRTFICEQGYRWIVDYKTSHHDQESIHAFLANEKNKYRDKMQQYAKSMKVLDEHEIKCALYFPAIPAWIEWSA